MKENSKKTTAPSPTQSPTRTCLSTTQKTFLAEITNSFLERKGKFQFILIILLSLNSITIGINHTITAFHVYVPNFACRNPLENCEDNRGHCPSGYLFNEEDARSVAVEWSLVCDKRMLAPLVNTMYFVGVTLGSLFCSSLCDILGRKKLVLVCMYAHVFMAFGEYFAESFFAFIVFRVVQGFFIQGLQNCTYTLIMEYCPSRHRTICSTLWECNWAIGLVVLSVASYFIRDWRLLTLVLTIPTILSLSYSWMIPESINWFLAKNKNRKALQLMKKIAKFNNSYDIVEQCNALDSKGSRNSVQGFQNVADINDSNLISHGFCDIFRNAVLRKL